VGEVPEGFGHSFFWGREEPQALLAVYISAGDFLGISIQGLQASDRIVVTSATGLASFGEDDGQTEKSIIGLIALGASVGSGLLGHPEAIPYIQQAEEYVQELFKPDNVHTLVRNAYGETTNGLMARQEGGVLVCLPEAGGTFYSGPHISRWIKGDSLPFGGSSIALPGSGERVPENYPDHVSGAFFLRRQDAQGLTPHTTHRNGGQAYLIAWDHIFPDNAGYYQLYVRLERAYSPQDGSMIDRRTRRFFTRM